MNIPMFVQMAQWYSLHVHIDLIGHTIYEKISKVLPMFAIMYNEYINTIVIICNVEGLTKFSWIWKNITLKTESAPVPLQSWHHNEENLQAKLSLCVQLEEKKYFNWWLV